MIEAPDRRTKLLFWYILGCLSTYFAEVWSGSQPFSFLNIQSYLLVIPLYTLHTLFLWTLIWRNGKPWLYTLFPAGCLFGLYEAYITKVLWNPTWETANPNVFGIALVETMVLVLFWHCFMSFIVPLLLGETVFTSSSEIYSLLPEWALGFIERVEDRKLYYVFPFFGGLFQSVGTGSVLNSILSGLLTTLYLVALLVLWCRGGGGRYSMRQLLPDDREFNGITLALAVYYVLTTFFMRVEEIPGLDAQATIWVLYAFFGALLFLAMRKSREVLPKSMTLRLSPSPVRLMTLGALISAGSVVGFVTSLNMVWALTVWLIGILFGLFVLLKTVLSLLSN
jgi:hypothetical protein